MKQDCLDSTAGSGYFCFSSLFLFSLFSFLLAFPLSSESVGRTYLHYVALPEVCSSNWRNSSGCTCFPFPHQCAYKRAGSTSTRHQVVTAISASGPRSLSSFSSESIQLCFPLEFLWMHNHPLIITHMPAHFPPLSKEEVNHLMRLLISEPTC